jgi:hypothetical protein
MRERPLRPPLSHSFRASVVHAQPNIRLLGRLNVRFTQVQRQSVTQNHSPVVIFESGESLLPLKQTLVAKERL